MDEARAIDAVTAAHYDGWSVPARNTALDRAAEPGRPQTQLPRSLAFLQTSA